MLYDSLESTILKPNQIAQYDKQNKKTTLKTIAAENTSAWINGHLYFDEENMETIALALERAFDVNITIKDETLKDVYKRQHPIHGHRLIRFIQIAR